MAIERRFCTNHPQRAAIGVCVMTGKAICGECSTRYEGVNYSREGLELLKKQRAAAAGSRAGGARRWGAIGVACCAWPVLLYLMYLGYLQTADVLTTLLHGAP